MNNSTTIDPCAWYKDSAPTAFIAAYYVITPIHTILGLFGHGMCLVAFYKQRKKDTAYKYQIFSSISQTIEVFFYAIYVACCYWFSGLDGPGSFWFMASYACMWFTAHFGLMLLNIWFTMSMFLAVAMSCDRIFAIAKPNAHRNINHSAHQATAVCICFFISVSINIFEYFRFYAELGPDGLYHILVHVQFVESAVGIGLSHLRNIVRAAGCIALFFCNITMVLLYRKQQQKVGTVLSSQSEIQRRKQQKILALSSFFEATFNCMANTILVIYYTFIYIDPDFFACKGGFVTPVADALIEICDVADFYVFFAVSSRFRRMLFESISVLKRFTSTGQNAG